MTSSTTNEVPEDVKQRFSHLPLEVQLEIADELQKVEDDMTTALEITNAAGKGKSDVQRVNATETLAAWSEDDLDDLCIVTEDDVEAAVESATPKLRDLNTTPSNA